MYPYQQYGQMPASGSGQMPHYPIEPSNQYQQQPFPPQQMPYMPQEPHHHHAPQYAQLKNETLQTVEPFVQYGLREAQHTSYPHAFREVAAITYLIGRGFSPRMAHQIVESWEMNEHF
ncbi:hypothetical protein [Bacillus horti]|uniref:Uncharacterized protein n=1 Tax=Caldalkalibacillus horti TaxID=77523 RepID=A0ABT9VWM1_9BACI|nr:hypothetical protein [Bacillus horti]MDQ0165290.1 hypothetical protein [Bacillus horti]